MLLINTEKPLVWFHHLPWLLVVATSESDWSVSPTNVQHLLDPLAPTHWYVHLGIRENQQSTSNCTYMYCLFAPPPHTRRSGSLHSSLASSATSSGSYGQFLSQPHPAMGSLSQSSTLPNIAGKVSKVKVRKKPKQELSFFSHT